MRLELPKALISNGMELPSTFSNSRALPPPSCLEILSVISVISRMGETDSLIRRSSPSRSSRSMNSLRDG